MMMKQGYTNSKMEEKTVTQNKQMWRSKLGTNYPKDFIEQNERRLLQELQNIRDTPENQMCADCGIRGTVEASVNLGVFLCMTCGAHHRSLGTHITIPKGCTGTEIWGPDEIQEMKSKGNARAKGVYGKGGPPNGVRNDDASSWKQYLTDKYVYKKFAPKAEQRGDVPTAPLSPFNSSPRASPRFSQRSPKFSHTPLPDIDLVHFESSSPRSPSSKTSPKSSVRGQAKQLPTSTYSSSATKRSSVITTPGKTGDDFFAEFGL